jgi:hypothetical protein
LFVFLGYGRDARPELHMRRRVFSQPSKLPGNGDLSVLCSSPEPMLQGPIKPLPEISIERDGPVGD